MYLISPWIFEHTKNNFILQKVYTSVTELFWDLFCCMVCWPHYFQRWYAFLIFVVFLVTLVVVNSLISMPYHFLEYMNGISLFTIIEYFKTSSEWLFYVRRLHSTIKQVIFCRSMLLNITFNSCFQWIYFWKIKCDKRGK